MIAPRSMLAEDMSRQIAMAIEIVRVVTAFVSSEKEAMFAIERAKLRAQIDEAFSHGVTTGRRIERGDTLVHLKSRRGDARSAAASIAAGEHVGKGAS